MYMCHISYCWNNILQQSCLPPLTTIVSVQNTHTQQLREDDAACCAFLWWWRSVKCSSVKYKSLRLQQYIHFYILLYILCTAVIRMMIRIFITGLSSPQMQLKTAVVYWKYTAVLLTAVQKEIAHDDLHQSPPLVLPLSCPLVLLLLYYYC